MNMDMNLLKIFDALCKVRNTTRAAELLGLSQPAVSHALIRLRHQLKDPLFVRASKGLVPTTRALELEKTIVPLLIQLDEALMAPLSFNPVTATNTFVIATTDYFEQVALPAMLKVLKAEAPNITLVFRPTLGDLPKEELENGNYDLAVAGFYEKLPEGFLKQKVFNDDFVCLSRQDHPRINKKSISLEQYAKEKHILISVHGDMKSKSQIILKKEGLEQKFRAGVSSFLSPGWIIASTDDLLTCPRKLALSYEKYLPISVFELPFELSPIQVVQVWHARSHREPAHIWLRQIIHDVCRNI